MTDYVWPDDLVPYAMSFWLQPHTGGSESPFNRVSKVYGLSAPRWVCSMSFRGGYWGSRGLEAIGPRLDAMLAKLKGRQNRVELYDFRRPKWRSRLWPPTIGTGAGAIIGNTQMGIYAAPPGVKIYAGDYIGGDGRPHIILDDTTVAPDGTATVTFEPPLRSNVAIDGGIYSKVTGMFRLISDDVGANGVQVGEAMNMTLEFVEDL